MYVVNLTSVNDGSLFITYNCEVSPAPSQWNYMQDDKYGIGKLFLQIIRLVAMNLRERTKVYLWFPSNYVIIY